jgi:hypothetical protein
MSGHCPQHTAGIIIFHPHANCELQADTELREVNLLLEQYLVSDRARMQSTS